ncbi:MAG: hypothetical protein IT304_11230 [Dehalococcoidia bacterium]|nr:hypothetical protein [Dehalococcoidia bacterium]
MTRPTDVEACEDVLFGEGGRFRASAGGIGPDCQAGEEPGHRLGAAAATGRASATASAPATPRANGSLIATPDPSATARKTATPPAKDVATR